MSTFAHGNFINEAALIREADDRRRAHEMLTRTISPQVAGQVAANAGYYPNMGAGPILAGTLAGYTPGSPEMDALAVRQLQADVTAIEPAKEPKDEWWGWSALKSASRGLFTGLGYLYEETLRHPVRAAVYNYQQGTPLKDVVFPFGTTGMGATGWSAEAQTLKAWGRGEPVNLGGGFFPRSELAPETERNVAQGMTYQQAAQNPAQQKLGAPITQLAHEKAQTSVTLEGINGVRVPVSAGRLAAINVFEPDTFAFNALSGILDVGVAVALDPSNLAFYGLGKLSKANRVLVGAGARKSFMARTWDEYLAAADGRAMTEAVANMGFNDVYNWLKGTQGTVDARFAAALADTTDAYEVQQLIRSAALKQGPYEIRDIALTPQSLLGRALRGPGEAGAVIAPQFAKLFGPRAAQLAQVGGLGLATRSKFLSGIATRPSARQGSYLAYLGAETGSPFLMPDDVSRSLFNFRQWMEAARFKIDEINDLSHQFARLADNDVAGMWGVKRAADRSFQLRLIEEGYDPATVKGLTRIVDTPEEMRKYFGDRVGRPLYGGPGTKRGEIVEGEQLWEPTALAITEFIDGNIPLLNPAKVRQALRKVRYDQIKNHTGIPITDLQGFNESVTMVADFAMQKIWKPLVLLRPAFTVRVIGEEQVRMAAAGLDSPFRHSLSYILWTWGKKGVTSGNLLEESAEFAAVQTKRMQWLHNYRGGRGSQMLDEYQTFYKARDSERFYGAHAFRINKAVFDPLSQRLAGARTPDLLDAVKQSFWEGDLKSYRQTLIDDGGEWVALAERAAADEHIEFQWARLHELFGGKGRMLQPDGTWKDFMGRTVNAPDDWVGGRPVLGRPQDDIPFPEFDINRVPDETLWDFEYRTSPYNPETNVDDISRRLGMESSTEPIEQSLDELYEAAEAHPELWDDPDFQRDFDRLIAEQERGTWHPPTSQELHGPQLPGPTPLEPTPLRPTQGLTGYVQIDELGHPELFDLVAAGPDGLLGNKAWKDHKSFEEIGEILKERWGDALPDSTYGARLGDAKMIDRYNQVLDTLFGFLMGTPTNVLSRSPAFKQFYWKRMSQLFSYGDNSVREQILREAQEAGIERGELRSWIRKVLKGTDEATIAKMESMAGPGYNLGSLLEAPVSGIDDIEHIRELARGYGLNETKKLLYDLSRRHQFFEISRNIFPFGEAWLEIMTTWSRLMVENPRLLRRIQQGVEGLREGDPVDALLNPADYDGKGFFYNDPSTGDEIFNMPGSELITKWMFGGQDDAQLQFTGRVAGLNLFLGNFLPGVGPLVQIPSSHLGFLEDPDRRWARDLLLPFGDVENISDAAIPAWFKKALIGFGDPDGNDERLYNNTVIDVYKTLIYRGAGSDATPDLMAATLEKAKRIAKNIYRIRAVSQFVGPTGAAVRYDVRDRNGEMWAMQTLATEYRRLLEDAGFDHDLAYQEFTKLFGVDPSLLYTAKTRSLERRSTTTVGAEFQARNPDLFEAFPLTAYYAMPDDPDGEFDYTAYLQQLEDGTREPVSPDDWAKLRNDFLGRLVYQHARNQITDPETGKVRADQDAVVWLRNLRFQLEERYTGYNQEIVGLGQKAERDQIIAEFENWRNSPGLANTPVGQAVIAYTTARRNALALIEREGNAPQALSSAKKFGYLRDWLHQLGSQIAQSVPQFAPAWEQVFYREIEQVTDEAPIELLGVTF